MKRKNENDNKNLKKDYCFSDNFLDFFAQTNGPEVLDHASNLIGEFGVGQFVRAIEQRAVTEGEYEGEAEIAILPPVDMLDVSDVEDIDENALEEVDPANVCGELDVLMMESVTESDDDVPLAHFDKRPKV
uniref:Uncharacterized protein n=1 Tax=Romanomermis culicivorax TaxID=13658 RepID=A0A915KBX9_ROMCU